MPSAVMPSTCCRRPTRELCSPQANAAVSTVDSDTGKATIVVVAAGAWVVGGGVVEVEVGTTLDTAAATLVVGDGVVVSGAVAVVVAPLVVIASSDDGSDVPVVGWTDRSSGSTGTRMMTGDPRVTIAPATGTCSATMPALPSRPSTCSTTVGEPIVLRTPEANWDDSPTTEGTSTSTGASANRGCSSRASPHPEARESAITIAATALIP